MILMAEDTTLNVCKKALIITRVGGMLTSNAPTFLTTTLCNYLCRKDIEIFSRSFWQHHKFMAKIFLILISLTLVSSCRMPESFGFYQPFTMSLEVPDGPPEYKAGWYGGCKSGLMQGAFTNAVAAYKTKMGPEFVNGVYQHDPAYQTGWGQGWFACTMHTAFFVGNPIAYPHGPLE